MIHNCTVFQVHQSDLVQSDLIQDMYFLFVVKVNVEIRVLFMGCLGGALYFQENLLLQQERNDSFPNWRSHCAKLRHMLKFLEAQPQITANTNSALHLLKDFQPI